MAVRRPVDSAVMKFYGAMAVITVAFFGGTQAFIYIVDGEGLNVAYTASWVVTVIFAVLTLEYAKRRPADALLSWGEAMMGATYVFLALFWAYGVLPHQWLVYADGELGWRADRVLVGFEAPWTTDSQGIVEWALPFTITYQVLRDIVAVTIYAFVLVGNVAMWQIWQTRGRTATVEVERSTYGRPILREGEKVEVS